MFGHPYACVAFVGYQLLDFAGVTSPSPEKIYNGYLQSGYENGFHFLSKFVEDNFPQLQAKYMRHEEKKDVNSYLQKCLEILEKEAVPIGISPGIDTGPDAPTRNIGHVAVLDEVDLEKSALGWWEAQSRQYRNVKKEDFDKRKYRTYEMFYLVKKNIS